MSLIDKAVEKARALRGKLAGTRSETGTQINAIRHDRFDEWSWDGLLSEVPVLKGDMRDLGMKHDQVEDFYEDMYNMLHQGDPKAREHRDMDAKHKANVDLANHFLDLPDVQSLRVSTMYDDYATAMGMRSLKEAMREAYELTDSARQQYQDAAEQEQRMGSAQGDLDSLLGQVSGLDPDSPEAEALAGQIDQLVNDIMAAQGITQQALADAQQAAEQAAKDAADAMGKAAKDASDELDDERKRAAAFGYEAGDLKRMDFDARAALAEKLRHVRDVDAFAAMIGQSKNVEMGEFRQRITNNPDEITNVRLSNDLTHLTSAEYMNLAVPEMETDFWRRYTEDRLLTYELSGTEKMGKGPVIYVGDESGSMGGAPEQWASGLAMALCQRCQRDGRDFTYIGFSNEYHQYRVDFPGGKGTIDNMIDMVTHFFGGGTHYETPLLMAAKIVEEYAEQGKDKPDIVFVTDDAYTTISEDFLTEWKRVKNATQMRVFGILLGTGSSGALDQVSDNVRTLDDVSNLDAVRDIFRTL